MNPAIIAAFLCGCVVGVFLLFAATGMLLAARDGETRCVRVTSSTAANSSARSEGRSDE